MSLKMRDSRQMRKSLNAGFRVKIHTSNELRPSTGDDWRQGRQQRLGLLQDFSLVLAVEGPEKVNRNVVGCDCFAER